GDGDAPAGRAAGKAVRGQPARADAPPPADAGDAVHLRAAGRVADAVAGDRRLGVRAAAAGAAPHPGEHPAAERHGDSGPQKTGPPRLAAVRRTAAKTIAHGGIAG